MEGEEFLETGGFKLFAVRLADMVQEGDCPVCFEEPTEPHVHPCPCGFGLCFWCWHQIKFERSGNCPNCRAAYGDSPTGGEFMAAKINARQSGDQQPAEERVVAAGLPYPLPKAKVPADDLPAKTLEILFNPGGSIAKRVMRDHGCAIVLAGTGAHAKWVVRERMLDAAAKGSGLSRGGTSSGDAGSGSGDPLHLVVIQTQVKGGGAGGSAVGAAVASVSGVLNPIRAKAHAAFAAQGPPPPPPPPPLQAPLQAGTGAGVHLPPPRLQPPPFPYQPSAGITAAAGAFASHAPLPSSTPGGGCAPSASVVGGGGWQPTGKAQPPTAPKKEVLQPWMVKQRQVEAEEALAKQKQSQAEPAASASASASKGGPKGAAAEAKGAASSGAVGEVRVFVWNLSWEVDEASLASHFEDNLGLPRSSEWLTAAGGVVVHAHVFTERGSGESKGSGVVSLAHPSLTTHAILKGDGSQLLGRAIRVQKYDFASSGGQGASSSYGGGNWGSAAGVPLVAEGDLKSTAVFVGGLDEFVTGSELHATLAPFADRSALNDGTANGRKLLLMTMHRKPALGGSGGGGGGSRPASFAFVDLGTKAAVVRAVDVSRASGNGLLVKRLPASQGGSLAEGGTASTQARPSRQPCTIRLKPSDKPVQTPRVSSDPPAATTTTSTLNKTSSSSSAQPPGGGGGEVSWRSPAVAPKPVSPPPAPSPPPPPPQLPVAELEQSRSPLSGATGQGWTDVATLEAGNAAATASATTESATAFAADVKALAGTTNGLKKHGAAGAKKPPAGGLGAAAEEEEEEEEEDTLLLPTLAQVAAVLGALIDTHADVRGLPALASALPALLEVFPALAAGSSSPKANASLASKKNSSSPLAGGLTLIRFKRLVATEEVRGFSWVVGSPAGGIPDRIRRAPAPVVVGGKGGGAAAAGGGGGGGGVGLGGAAAAGKPKVKPEVAGPAPSLGEVAAALGNAIDFAGGKLGLPEASTIVRSLVPGFPLLGTTLKPLVVGGKLAGVAFLNNGPSTGQGFFVRAHPNKKTNGAASGGGAAAAAAAVVSSKAKEPPLDAAESAREKVIFQAVLAAVAAQMGNKAPVGRKLNAVPLSLLLRKEVPGFKDIGRTLKVLLKAGLLPGLCWVDLVDQETGAGTQWVQKTAMPTQQQNSPKTAEAANNAANKPPPRLAGASSGTADRAAVLAAVGSALGRYLDTKCGPNAKCGAPQAGTILKQVPGYSALDTKLKQLVISGALPGFAWTVEGEKKSEFVARVPKSPPSPSKASTGAPRPNAGGGGGGGAAAFPTKAHHPKQAPVPVRTAPPAAAQSRSKQKHAAARTAPQARTQAAALHIPPPPVDRGSFFLGGL